MSKKKITNGVLIVVAVVVVAHFYVVPSIVSRARTLEVEGTITRVDVEAREASFEFLHFKHGKLREATSTVPADCPIFLNGQPAQLEDIRAGDHGLVKATWNKRQKELNLIHAKIQRPVEKIETEPVEETPETSDQ